MNRTIDFFYEISRIPRESGNESKIAEYLCDFAEKRNLFYIKDEYNLDPYKTYLNETLKLSFLSEQ